MHFFIAELEDGYTVLELPDGMDANDVAADAGGVVVDEGPFASFEDANDALVALEEDTHDADRV
jgi:hypothetical protein